MGVEQSSVSKQTARGIEDSESRLSCLRVSS